MKTEGYPRLKILESGSVGTLLYLHCWSFRAALLEYNMGKVQNSGV